MHWLLRRRLECHQQLDGVMTDFKCIFIITFSTHSEWFKHIYMWSVWEKHIKLSREIYFEIKSYFFGGKMELLFRISLRNNTMCVHCAVFIYQCCKQRSPGRDSRNPLPFPSPKKRWSQDHPEVVCAPVSYENTWCLSSAPRYLRNVVFKDIQGCEIALGVGGQDHGELKYILM